MDAIPDRIKFANSFMSDQERNFVDQYLRYNLKQWKKTGTFDNMNSISEYVTLVLLMDSPGFVNHVVSVLES